MTNTLRRSRERGATALIIVIFFTLLLTVLSVGFVQMMVQEQKASQDSELSQGAYDSALAGAEDGKRVLKSCLDGNADACAAIDAQNCNTVSATGLVPSGPDGSVVQSKVDASSSSTGKDYSQAYTCVVIKRNTSDVVGTLAADSSVIEPLRSVNSAPYDSLLVTWFKRSNSTSDLVALDPAGDNSLNFTPTASWTKDRPPVFRVQLMQYKQNDLNVADFNQTGGSSTVYLYPKRAGGLVDFANDGRFDPAGKKIGSSIPYAAKCSTTFQNVTYACQATIHLPNPVNGGEGNRVAFVRLTALYNNADFSLQLMRAGNVVEFDGVQPKIDSTGRAADVYRRIVERVESTDAMAAQSLYPRATVDTTNNFCKDMSVTTQAAEYQNNCPAIP